MRYFKQVSLIHDHISKQEGMFLKFSTIIKHIKTFSFENEYLQQLKGKLLGHDNLEKQLNILSKLIKKLDYRLNVIVAIVLNLLFYWDIQYSYKVEKWMKDNSPNIPSWLETIGEFDAYLSMSVLYYNNSDWSFPTIIDNRLIIDTKEIGHPLIDKDNRVTNDYKIESKSKFDIVTGSNMAGKSTFLRTIGTNTVLAQNGCPVCAKSFTVSNIKLITYMRIIDSLEDNLSTFHAELERIKSILKYVEENDNCFLLLDELLRGTNSQDRHVGTIALIKQMMRNKASGMIATHDLGLTDMIKDYPDNIRNYNFGVKTKDGELYFDYKLTYGVCDSFNASILMKKIGIDIDLVSM
jgi:DNA mismatch repair ATPase MutS